MSAFSVVTPDVDGLLGVERRRARCPSACPTARCGSTSAGPSSRPRRPPRARRRCRGRSCSSRSRRPSCPCRRPGPGCWEEWCCSPLNTSMPGISGTFGLPDMPVAMTSCLGRSVTSAPSRSTTTIHSPRVLVVLRALGLGRAPVVQLHHPRVHLEPVADLVLRREDRPVLGELDVRAGGRTRPGRAGRATCSACARSRPGARCARR